MPRHVYDLTTLWRWMRDRQVTAREIADYLGCEPRYVRDRVLVSLERGGMLIYQVGARREARRGICSTVYAPCEWEEK